MDTGQKLENQQVVVNGIVHQNARNAEIFDQYLTFCAASGLSMDEDGEIRNMTVKEFAHETGVARSVLYYWKANVPNFWTLVDKRARQIFNQSTKFAIMKGLKLKAMAGDPRAAEMVLSHYSDYTPPAQKHELKLGGWGDVVRDARKAKIKAKRPPLEGEVVNPRPAPPVTDAASPSHTGGPIQPQITGKENGPEVFIPADPSPPPTPPQQPIITGPISAPSK